MVSKFSTTSARLPRGSLNRDAILDSAEELLSGPDGTFSMRTLSTRVACSPMAIYRHFSNRDDVVRAVLDRVVGHVVAPPRTASWAKDLEDLARAHFDMLSARPWVIQLLVHSPAPGPATMELGERFYEILSSSPLAAEETFPAFSAIIALNYGWVAFAAARNKDSNPSEDNSDISRALSTLPDSNFPHTRVLDADILDFGSTRQYEVALRLLIRGLVPPN